MRMIWQGIRAVTVEAMGVGAVIFMLFSAAGWTMESAGVQPKQEAERAWKWLQVTSDHLTASIKPNLTADQRERFAAERLDHYGQWYRKAAGDLMTEAARELELEFGGAQEGSSLPPNQLLGTL